MTYFILFTFVVAYVKLLEIKYENNYSLLHLLPPFLVLLLTLSLQHDVGTDYNAYYEMASKEGNILLRIILEEQLFAALIYLSKFLGNPQYLFFLSSFIQLSFLFLLIKELKNRNYSISMFLFLYFTLSLSFFNQFNGIRQFIAVYIVVYALFKLFDNKYLHFSMFIILASLFHSSAIYLFLLLLGKKILEKEYKFIYILGVVIVLLIISTFDLSNIIKLLLSYTKYANYAFSTYFKRTKFLNILTKLPKIAIIMFSAYSIKDIKLQKTENQVVNLAYFSIIIQILSFTSKILFRFYLYFDLFSIFPVLFYFRYKNEKFYQLLIVFLLILMLFLKILIFPKGEYLYQSILFN